MTEVENRLRESGCPKVNLQIRSDNDQAVGFYRAIGYTRDDVVSMGKRLERDEQDSVDLDDVVLRVATPRDAAAAAEVYLASRRAFLPFAPPAHSDDDVRRHFASDLIPSGLVTVAVTRGGGGPLVGVMAISRSAGVGWIDQMYLLPSAVGRGIGGRLLEHARSSLGSPIRLYTFQANDGARRFYERHGFRVVAFGDGSQNEERCPDVLYEWVH
jgi:ribosomal protein S18 acetylase RimI-like enzyme